jgi:hypothetical protein
LAKKFRRKNILKRHHTHTSLFRCGFNVNVSCPLVKSEKFMVLNDCFACCYYVAFCKEMDREEEATFREIKRRLHGEVC